MAATRGDTYGTAASCREGRRGRDSGKKHAANSARSRACPTPSRPLAASSRASASIKDESTRSPTAFVEAARANPWIAALRSAVIPLLSGLGRLDEAHEQLAAEAAAGFDFPYNGRGSPRWLISSTSPPTSETRSLPRMLIERVAPFAGHVISLRGMKVNGAIARPLGRAATVLGDYDQAEHWFAIAHDIHNRLQAPYWAALGQLDHADLCLARHAEGDLQRARDFASTATATASEYGCAGLTKRAKALLAEL